MSDQLAAPRRAEIHRQTSESDIVVALDLDGSGQSVIDTGVGFFDHMLSSFARHGLFDMTVRATGDLHIDTHHTIEDTAIALGAALARALGDKRGLRRFGHATVPLDESLVRAVVDLAGRPYVVHTEPEGLAPMIGGYDTTMTRHIFESMAHAGALCVHIDVLRGRNAHHVVEAQFKAVARALRDAVARDPRELSVPSTKGSLTEESAALS
jgi:imidazoleglycerol-phosphate dehydratase